MSAAITMRSLQINEAHRSRIDSELRDNERNIKFFKERLEAIKQRKVQQGLGAISLVEAGGSQSPPVPPPKDAGAAWGDQASYADGSVQYAQVGQHGDLVPPRHPYAGPGPGSGMPKARPNFTKLGVCQNPRRAPRPSLLTVACLRSRQIRHATPRPPNPAHALPDPVQAQRRGAIPQGCREDGPAVRHGGRSQEQG